MSIWYGGAEGAGGLLARLLSFLMHPAARHLVGGLLPCGF